MKNALIRLDLQVIDKLVVVKVPKKYCTPVSELSEKVYFLGHTYIPGTVIDSSKLKADGYDCIIWIKNEGKINLVAVPNMVSDCIGVMIKDTDFMETKESIEAIVNWAHEESPDTPPEKAYGLMSWV